MSNGVFPFRIVCFFSQHLYLYHSSVTVRRNWMLITLGVKWANSFYYVHSVNFFLACGFAWSVLLIKTFSAIFIIGFCAVWHLLIVVYTLACTRHAFGKHRHFFSFHFALLFQCYSTQSGYFPNPTTNSSIIYVAILFPFLQKQCQMPSENFVKCLRKRRLIQLQTALFQLNLINCFEKHSFEKTC